MPGLLGLASLPDLLRLVAVPVFGWAAYRDIRTRRVPNSTWYPLVAIGLVALAWESLAVLDASGYRQQLFVIRAGASLLVVAPLGYVFWRLGGFGGADAKAVMTLALLYPTFPTFYLPWAAWPVHEPPLGVFSLTVLSNTVVLGFAYPMGLALANLLRGRLSPAMFVGRPVPVGAVPRTYGRLLETPSGLTRRGLDVDALRMYLRWRGLTFPAVRADPERYRDPHSLPPPAERNDPGDGALADGPPVTDGGREGRRDDARPGDGASDPASPGTPGGASGASPTPAVRRVDWWGAEAFLAEAGSAYGTTPADLRAGLETLTDPDREVVWVSPGIPFIVPMFLGLVVALTYGDLLFRLLVALGVA